MKPGRTIFQVRRFRVLDFPEGEGWGFILGPRLVVWVRGQRSWVEPHLSSGGWRRQGPKASGERSGADNGSPPRSAGFAGPSISIDGPSFLVPPARSLYMARNIIPTPTKVRISYIRLGVRVGQSLATKKLVEDEVCQAVRRAINAWLYSQG